MTSQYFTLHNEHSSREPHGNSMESCRQPIGLFVDRSTRQWVVRDPDGALWLLGTTDWADRRPFDLSDEADLEIVPGHYRYMLDLPF